MRVPPFRKTPGSQAMPCRRRCLSSQLADSATSHRADRADLRVVVLNDRRYHRRERKHPGRHGVALPANQQTPDCQCISSNGSHVVRERSRFHLDLDPLLAHAPIRPLYRKNNITARAGQSTFRQPYLPEDPVVEHCIPKLLHCISVL